MKIYSKEELIKMGMKPQCSQFSFFAIGRLLDKYGRGKWRRNKIQFFYDYIAIQEEWQKGFHHQTFKYGYPFAGQIIRTMQRQQDHMIQKKCEGTIQPQWANSKGIYGIYVDNELVYVGQTTTSFKIRFGQYKQELKETDGRDIIKIIKQAKMGRCQVEMKPIHIMDGKSEKEIRQEEKRIIEKYKPVGNIEGVRRKYAERKYDK